MAKILLYWGWDADLIECPECISNNLSKYQRDFDAWISNPKNEHKYWSIDSEGEPGLCFNGEAFLNWLNEVVLKDSDNKAHFIKQEYVPNKLDMKLPRINF